MQPHLTHPAPEGISVARSKIPDRSAPSTQSDFNDELRRSGHYVEAEALSPSAASTCLRIRDGKTIVTDGPFTEAKEMVAGFYLLEVRDRDEALRIAERIPSAGYATIEVRPVHTLVVEGRS